MVAGLTLSERQLALVILLALGLAGLAMAIAGRGDLMGGHGFVVLAFSLGVAFLVMAGFYAPEPGEERLSHYYDDPTRAGIVLTMAWAVFGMFFGVWVSALLAWPELTFVDQAWASFGRLRPVHTTGVIFGFGGNALIATSFHVLQRTSRARLPGQLSPWFVLLGYNLFCVLAVTGYFMGITQSKEYAEPEWYADIWLVVVWVVYFLIYIRTLQRRQEPHIYVANWYYMAFILVVAVLHIVNNLALPIGLVWPYRRFKTLHLRHHADERLTDPFDDPESYYRALWQYRSLPGWLQFLLRVNNTMAGRLVIGPLLANAGFLAGEARLIRAGDRQVVRAWLHHAAGLIVVVPMIVFLFDMPFWLYVLVPAYLGQSLIAVRTFAEHQWSERPDGRTIIVERSPLALLFLNNNLHLVHHKMPNVAWYDLPAQFRARREEWLHMNGGYAYPGYLALLRDFAFRAKEPVAHPVLRREAEPGRAFRPRMRSRAVHGAGMAPVPSKPPEE